MRNNVRNMRNSSVLTALFPQVRQGVLAATLGQPDKWWYLSELAGRLGTSPSSLQRELSSLVASGILVHRREGLRRFVSGDFQYVDCRGYPGYRRRRSSPGFFQTLE